MPFDIIIVPFLQLLLTCIRWYDWLLIIYLIMGLLMAFNTLNRGNIVVYGIYSTLARIIEPVLSPIRRMLPKTGMFDFSVLVLFLILQFFTTMLNMIFMKYFAFAH